MPFTAAEKQKRYREKLKESGKYNQYKKKNAEQQERKRARLKGITKRLYTERNCAYKRKEREKKKPLDSSGDVTPIIVPDSSSATSAESIVSTPTRLYGSRQSLGKARKRLKMGLRNSQTKRLSLIADYAAEIGLLPKKTRAYSKNAINNNVNDAVVKFYNDDAVSSQAPGIKDYVIVRKDGEKTKIQKRYLYLTLKENHGVFCETHPELKVGKSKFAELRPPHVCLQQDIPHNACLCKMHENIRLLLKALKAKEVPVKTEFRQFIDQVVCDQDSVNCMQNKCNGCPGINGIELLDKTANMNCEWEEWVTLQQVVKTRHSGTVNDCLEDLADKLGPFLAHTFTKRIQSQEFKSKRETIQHKEIIVQVDFAENFSCKEQDEIQSAHWSNTQVSVFTAVVWFVNSKGEKDVKSFAFVSDCLDHDKYSVYVYMKKIFDNIRSYTNYESVHAFSDGAASQFKQKFNFCNLSYFSRDYKVSITWHFFATSHGKGSVDGVGGEVKRLAWVAARSGKSVKNAHDFVTVVKERVLKIQVILVHTDEIINVKELLDKRWENISSVPGTQKLHCFQAAGINRVRYAKLSNSIEWFEHHFSTIKDIGLPQSNEPIIVTIEAYYAVYYDEKYYIGRVIEQNGNNVKVKFLREILGEMFKWPQNPEVEWIDVKFLFYGPLVLKGTGPFQVDQLHELKHKYKSLKQL